MSKLLFLCLGMVLLAVQFGCGGGAANNANNADPVNSNNPANPANPNNPNTPPNVNGPAGGPIAQENGKGGKPNLANANTIAPAPTDDGGLGFAAMDFHGALIHGNKDQMAVLMADDYKGTIDGAVQNKSQTLAAAKFSDQMYSANVAKPDVKGDTATITGTITFMGADPAAAKNGAVLKFNDVWRKRGSKWQITSTTITK